MGSFPTSVAQRLLKQLFMNPTAFAHGVANIPLYNSSTTTSGSTGITAPSAGAVSLYVGLLWSFSNTGPAASGGFPGGNSFGTGIPGGIYDNHIRAVGNWGADTTTNNYTNAGIACPLASTTPATYTNARLAELTNGGFTGRGNVTGSLAGNGLTRQPITFVVLTGQTFNDTEAAASPAVQSNNTGSSPTTTPIAFGTFTANVASPQNNFDGISMTAANCSIVGFFITPLAGTAITGSWGQGSGAAAAASAVDANRPWIIAYGQLSSSRSINVGDQPQFTATAITITLA